jgi:hypothetical protein
MQKKAIKLKFKVKGCSSCPYFYESSNNWGRHGECKHPEGKMEIYYICDEFPVLCPLLKEQDNG